MNLGQLTMFGKVFSRQSSSNCKVGFIGLGNMGSYMAVNLLKSGHQISVLDKDQERVKNLKNLAANKDIQVVKSVKDFGNVADLKVIITMLPSSPQVIDVYKNESLLKNTNKKTIFIDCTTGDPLISKEIGREANKCGHIYVDAPVSGGVNAARDGLLTFMVGGEKDDVEKASVYLQKMGKNIFHCGPVGTGLAAKICNNMLLAISMIGVAEAMNLGAKLGLEPSVLNKVINSSSGRCWSSDTYNPVPGVMNGVPSSRDYEGGFGVDLMAKDLGLSQISSINQGTKIPLGSAAHQIYRMLCDQGYSKKDFSVIYKFLSEIK